MRGREGGWLGVLLGRRGDDGGLWAYDDFVHSWSSGWVMMIGAGGGLIPRCACEQFLSFDDEHAKSELSMAVEFITYRLRYLRMFSLPI